MASTFHINRNLFPLHMDLDPEEKKNPKLGQINKRLMDENILTLKMKRTEKR